MVFFWCYGVCMFCMYSVFGVVSLFSHWLLFLLCVSLFCHCLVDCIFVFCWFTVVLNRCCVLSSLRWVDLVLKSRSSRYYMKKSNDHCPAVSQWISSCKCCRNVAFGRTNEKPVFWRTNEKPVFASTCIIWFCVDTTALYSYIFCFLWCYSTLCTFKHSILWINNLYLTK